MSKPTFISKNNAKVVDLGTKIITKYTSPDKKLEINHVHVDGRHPDNSNQFIYETDVHFMVYVVKGKGTIYVNEEIYTVQEGDVVDVPVKTRFAAEGNNLEYLAIETPAWYPEQAFIVDGNGSIVEETEI